MNYRVVMPLAAGMLALGGCFNPDPPRSSDTNNTNEVGSDSTSSGAVDSGSSDESDGCADGCMTTSAECSDDCTQLSDECNEGVCEAGSCVAQPRDEGSSCDDGLFCTEGDTCTAGVCGGTEMECPSDDPCTAGVCDEDADACGAEPIGDGGSCDDADLCTGDGTCMAGACEPGPDLCAELDTECSAGTCNPELGCEMMPANDGGACDAANPCGQSTCVAGSCVLTVPLNDGAGCEDGDFCTFGDVCSAGICSAGVAAACPENDVCGTWACDEAADACVLAPQNEGALCDDNNACTMNNGSECVMGECLFPTPGGPVLTYLWEDFADNSAAWALGPEWEIGPAMVSVGGNPGADPGVDHTPSADEGVAGVVIGGQADIPQHAFYYLTSPPMNVPPVQPAFLGFYRWLNSDYDPYMHNSIEVWDGVDWVQIWVSGPAPSIADTEWTYVEHDLSAYTNDAMRVRFGFDIASDGVFSAPSWNVDDVLVSSITCP